MTASGRPVRILGIDPGTIACGYGVVEVAGSVTFGRPRYIECGVIELDEKAPLPERLRILAEDLRDVLHELKPHEVALESVFYGKNVQSALRLGYARGVIMMLIAEAALALSEYPPATVKRAVAGNVRAEKSEVQRMVSVLCSLKAPPRTDAADALAIAICHAQHRGIARAPLAAPLSRKPPTGKLRYA
jgi:crossover junction endodeoxyribonuclease RuvC